MTVPATFAPKMDVSTPGLDLSPRVTKLSEYAVSSTWKSTFQLVNTVLPYIFCQWLMYKSLVHPYWVTLLLSIPTFLLTIRLFIFQHDAGHGSFYNSRKLNDLVGFWIGVVTLSPYHYWRKTHAIHHATSGNLDKRGFGDIDTYTVKEYLSLSKAQQWRYRLYRHPFTMFILGPIYQFVLKHRLPIDSPKTWTREWRSVHLTNLVLALILGGVIWAGAFKSFIKVQAPVTFFACAVGAWLFYIQHQYENTYWERDDKWDYFEASVKGSSYYALPRLLEWCTGSIGYHHIHHYNSRIPNYRLRDCFINNPEFQKVTRLTLASSLKSIRLALWDEDKKRLIRFRDLPATA